MAAIHVVYVRKKSIDIPTEVLRALDASYAVLQVPDEMTDEQIEGVAKQLAKMVLENSVPSPAREEG